MRDTTDGISTVKARKACATPGKPYDRCLRLQEMVSLSSSSTFCAVAFFKYNISVFGSRTLSRRRETRWTGSAHPRGSIGILAQVRFSRSVVEPAVQDSTRCFERVFFGLVC